MKKGVVEKIECEIVQNVFNTVEKIVTSVRRTHKQQQLSRKLQTYSTTRFNGSFYMLDDFRLVYDELPSILLKNKLIEDFQSILEDICTFMQPFHEVIESLSDDQRPTLHRVIPLRQYLLNKCDANANGSLGLYQLKTFLGKNERCRSGSCSQQSKSEDMK